MCLLGRTATQNAKLALENGRSSSCRPERGPKKGHRGSPLHHSISQTDSPKRPTDWTTRGKTGSVAEQEETGERNADTNSVGSEEERERNSDVDIPEEEEEKGERYRDPKDEEETAEDWFDGASGHH
ncbi:hypothetical protein NDU88_003428 [Pleurodeles waltl]|uniref:Uncharacterized protein n=1 Tax=Pleurodeles waltl TaxID=8319 RepID=A0AAV7WT13_PLEWA|nr:hypothetical protein NDU88_003428 [Pleurodeles waltl]